MQIPTRSGAILQRIQRLFFPPSDPLSAPSYTQLTLFNYRAEFLEHIETLQQRVDDYKLAVDAALESLTADLPPSSPDYFLRIITEDEYNGAPEDSPSLDSSDTDSQNPHQ
jgi:hypothetical protein